MIIAIIIILITYWLIYTVS